MVEITDLPPEILTVVLSYFTAFDSTISLIKCGDKRLSHRLSSACTSIVLKGTEERPKLPVFPKMISSFRHLRSLHLNRTLYKRIDVVELAEDLQQLPPTLEDLDLTCTDAFAVFTNLYDAVDPPINSRFPRGTSSFWNVAKCFPSLKRLVIWTLGWETYYLGSTDFAALPDSLTELSIIGEVSLSECDLKKVFSSLPPAIEDLRLPFEESSDAFEHLPKGLIEVKGIYDWHPEHYRFIPPTAKIVEGIVVRDFAPETSLAIPPTLLTLQLASVLGDRFTQLGTHWCSALPKALTRLYNGSRVSALTREAISALPRTLTYLDWNGPISWIDLVGESKETAIDDPTIEKPPLANPVLWPPALKNFYTPLSRDNLLPGLECLKLFPSTLTELSIAHQLSDLTSLANLRCQSLTSLSLYYLGEGTTGKKPLPIDLPPRLTYLSDTLCTSFENHETLPINIQRLALPSAKIEAGDTIRFPPNLQLLQLGTIAYDGLDKLPDTLTELQVNVYAETSAANVQTKLNPQVKFTFQSFLPESDNDDDEDNDDKDDD